MRIRHLLGLLVAASLAMSACSASMGAPETSGGADYYSAEADEYDMAEDTGGDAREIITTGSLTLISADMSGASDGIVAIVEDTGGFVESRYFSTRTEYRSESAWLTVRVPAAELQGVIDAVEEFGEVRELHISTDDVTRYGRDLDARISALEASTERLLELMSEADSSEALIAAESALSDRQGELEALRSERRYLSDQVAMSTLEINILPATTAEFDRGGFLGGILKGWNSLVSTASSLMVGLGAALPWLVVLGLPLTGAVWLVRRRRARRRKDSLEGGD